MPISGNESQSEKFWNWTFTGWPGDSLPFQQFHNLNIYSRIITVIRLAVYEEIYYITNANLQPGVGFYGYHLEYLRYTHV